MELLLKSCLTADTEYGVCDILVKNGIIARIAGNIPNENNWREINCEGLHALPGLFDMHVHFRDPGQTAKEDIISGAHAAAAGGITGAVCMPNTSPPADSPEIIKYMLDKAKTASIKLYPAGCVTKGLAGNELCDFKALKEAGCAAVSDDGKPVKSAALMAKAMKEAHIAGLPILSHCEDLDIISGGIINKGEISEKLGVKGMDRLSEDTITSRETVIAADNKTPIHVCHVSTKESVRIIRDAVKSGAPVTCETCPHYFFFTEDKLLSRDADYRMNPPLRTSEDVKAIIEGVCDGTINCIVTDHAPHTAAEKSDFLKAPNGVVGLETSLAAALTAFYHTGLLPLSRIVELMCINPRKILSIPGGELKEGEAADICLADLNEEWIVDPEKLHSKSKNTCFKGVKLKGKVKYTILDGNIVYKD